MKKFYLYFCTILALLTAFLMPNILTKTQANLSANINNATTLAQKESNNASFIEEVVENNYNINIGVLVDQSSAQINNPFFNLKSITFNFATNIAEFEDENGIEQIDIKKIISIIINPPAKETISLEHEDDYEITTTTTYNNQWFIKLPDSTQFSKLEEHESVVSREDGSYEIKINKIFNQKIVDSTFKLYGKAYKTITTEKLNITTNKATTETVTTLLGKTKFVNINTIKATETDDQLNCKIVYTKMKNTKANLTAYKFSLYGADNLPMQISSTVINPENVYWYLNNQILIGKGFEIFYEPTTNNNFNVVAKQVKMVTNNGELEQKVILLQTSSSIQPQSTKLVLMLVIVSASVIVLGIIGTIVSKAYNKKRDVVW